MDTVRILRNIEAKNEGEPFFIFLISNSCCKTDGLHQQQVRKRDRLINIFGSTEYPNDGCHGQMYVLTDAVQLSPLPSGRQNEMIEQT